MLRRRTIPAATALLAATLAACGGAPGGRSLEPRTVSAVRGLVARSREARASHADERMLLQTRLVTDELLVVDPGETVRFGLLRFPSAVRLEVDLLLWRDGAVVGQAPASARVRATTVDGEGDQRTLEADLAWRPNTAHQVEASLELEAAGPIRWIELEVGFPGGELPAGTRVVLVRPEARFADRAFVRAAGEPPARQVLLVTLDTFRADHLGSYGSTEVATPRLDELAREGARFESCYATANVTKPSHASIFTSLGPLDHGVVSNRHTLTRAVPSMVEALRERGFATAAFPASANFRAAHTALSERFAEFFDFGTQQRRAEDVNRHVLPWLAGHAADDWFVWVHYYDVHAPYDPPPPFDRMYWDEERFGGPPPTGPEAEWPDEVPPDRVEALHALYRGEASYLDREVGVLLDALRVLGLLEAATIVVTADHGEAFGELGIHCDHPGLSDGTTHVPLLVKPPGTSGSGAAGVVVPGLVSTLDVYPTVFDYLDLPVPDGLRGESLRPLIEGAGSSARERVFSVHARATSVSVRTATERFTLGLSRGPKRTFAGAAGLVTERLGEGEVELYEYGESTFEGANAAPARTDAAARLRAVLDAHVAGARRLPARDIHDEDFEEELRALGYL